MRIACPSCQAEYDVPDTLLAGRNAVRCARCGEEWRPEGVAVAPTSGTESLPASIAEPEGHALTVAEMAEPAPAQPVTPSLFVPPRDPRAVPVRPPSRRAGAAILGGWVATIVILIALAAAGYAWRDRMMAAWPPSTRLYAALGLAHH